MPAGRCQISPPDDAQSTLGQGILQGFREAAKRVDLSHYVIYVDESGGRYASDPSKRRCGWGFAALPRHQRDLRAAGHDGPAGWVAGNLVGPV